MKIRSLSSAGIVCCLLATASRAAVFPYAEYHLGETGSLAGGDFRPQDSSGANRHLNQAQASNASSLVSNAVSPAAIGSTACLDTSAAGHQSWGGFETFSNLPTDNFAFGIFAKSSGSSYAPVFALGDIQGAYIILQNGDKWSTTAYRGSGIQGQPQSFTPDTWAHLAVIRQNGVTKFYVNGVDQGGSFTMPPVHRDGMLSKNFYTETFSSFDGLLDEARVVTFPVNEPTANILSALQAGAPTPAFIRVGGTGSVPMATLLPTETSVFRIGGAVQDFMQVTGTNGLQVAGTAPEKHIIQIQREGTLANGRYPLIGFSGTIGGQGLAGLQLAEIPGRIAETLEINPTTSTIDLVISGAEGVTWTGANSALWDKAATNWVLGGTSTTTQFLDADDVKFDDSAAGTVNAITVAEGMAPAALTVDGSENFSFSGFPLSLSGPLTKKGTGSLALANGFSGSSAIAIQGGTLSVGDGGTGGSIGTGPISLGSGQLVVNRSGDVSLPNAITGPGSIAKQGSGRLIIQSPTLLNGVTLSAGQIGAGRVNLFGGVTIAAGASLDYRGFTPDWIPPVINGSGVNGEGAIVNSGAFFTMRETLQLGSDAAVGGGMGMKNRGPVTYNDPYPQTYPCFITGNHKFSKVGGGTFSFYKTTVTVKDIEILSGSLLADQHSAINNTYPGTITIHSSASLEFGNEITYDPTVQAASCAKPIVLKGGTVATAGGPMLSAAVGSIQLDASGGTLVAERHSFNAAPNGPVPTANLHVTGVVSGSGSLTVGGYGFVSLTQAPAYAGDTTILGQPGNNYGRLWLAAPGLADTSTVSIADGATLNLIFNGTDTVRRLFLNGVQQQPGVYGSSNISGRIIGQGTLTVTEGPAAPPYQLWATASGIAGAAADVDSDGDGISNGLEFVLGGNPSSPEVNPNGLMPTITRTGNTMKFIYRRTDASSANYAMRVETNANPATNSWVSTADNPYNPQVLVESDGFGPGVDKVTVTISTVGAAKLFARLKIDIP
jgi:hypothetical protein